jgi:hypothetical protein
MSEAEVRPDTISVKNYPISKKDKRIVLELYKYGSPDANYGIRHVNTGHTIIAGFMYKNVANQVASEILLHHGLALIEADLETARSLFTGAWFDYIAFYVYREVKNAHSFNEFCTSSDYETYLISQHDLRMVQESIDEFAKELSDSFMSVPYCETQTSDSRSTITGRDLEDLINGYPLTSSLTNRYNNWKEWFYSVYLCDNNQNS